EPRIVSAGPKRVATGWKVSGQMKAGPVDIHFLTTRVVVRDPSGLLYNGFRLTPGDNHTIAAGSLIDFETEPNPAEFCGYDIFNDFGYGPAPPTPDGRAATHRGAAP